MQIKIKRNYYEATKDFLKDLKKYHYIKNYTIMRRGSAFVISITYNGELVEFKTQDDDVMAETIHALVEANKNIIFN